MQSSKRREGTRGGGAARGGRPGTQSQQRLPPSPAHRILHVRQPQVVDALDHQWRHQVLSHEAERLCTGGNPQSEQVKKNQKRTKQVSTRWSGGQAPVHARANVPQDDTHPTQYQRRGKSTRKRVKNRWGGVGVPSQQGGGQGQPTHFSTRPCSPRTARQRRRQRRRPRPCRALPPQRGPSPLPRGSSGAEAARPRRAPVRRRRATRAPPTLAYRRAPPSSAAYRGA